MTAFRLSSRVSLWLLSPLVVLSACGRSNSGTLSVQTRPEVVDAAGRAQAAKDKDTSTCLEPGKVLAGVEYTCADGKKRKGMFLADSLQECSKDGETGCVSSGSFPAVEKARAAPGFIKSGVTLAGVAGTLTFQGPANCAADGETGCVSTAAFPAVDKSLLTPGVLKSGVTVAGIVGAYPSASFPLAGADGAVADLSDLSPTIAAGTYEFFDSAGVRKTGQIVDQGTVTPGLADQTISPSSGLMRSVVVKGDAGLLAVNIKGGVSLFGVTGSIAGVPATCSSDGQSNCVASASYPAANATGLASKILSGQTVAGVAGNVTLPAAASVRATVSYGVGGNGTTGSLGNCASEGASACVVDAATTFRAASTTGLAAKILTGQSVAGVSGSAALRPADCTADGGTGCVAVTGFVAADTTGLASKVLSGQTVAGVAGNVTLPSASSVLASASYGVGSNGTTGSIATCSALSRTGCYAGVGWTGVETSDLTAGNIRNGFTLGGVAGGYPSATHRLAGADATADLTSLAATTAAGSYEFFDSAGTRYTGSITDAGTITVGTSAQTFNTSLYRSFTVPGDANLVAANIASGVAVLGVTGSAALRPSDCAADGATNCVSVAAFRAADTSGLASKVLSGQSVAGVSGNVTLPVASVVRTSASYGVGGNGTTGTLADCALDGATGCVSTVGFPAANVAFLSPGNIKKSATIAGVTGDYPSSTYPLPGASGTDLPSLASSVAAGTYQFWQKDGTRITGSITDAGSITVGTADQTFSTSLYRTFTVPGDADLVASNIASGVNILGVAGSAALKPADCSADGSVGCVTTASYKSATISGLAAKVLSTATVAGETGTVVLPGASDVRSGVAFGAASALSGSYSPDFPDVANVRAGDTVNGAAGTLADCSADGQAGCVVPSSGTIKAADTANFTNWDIRRKRNSSGTLLTFAGITGLSKTCRNRANITNLGTGSWGGGNWNNTTAPALAELDFFDTIDDANNGLTGLPGDIPAWTMLIGGQTVTAGNDFKCGGIYATGSTATGNTGADSSLAHDADGNWQDLTPGILPGGANSGTNTSNGCNAADKHCVFRELISGLMVTEISAADYTWQNAITYCDTLGETGNPVTALRSPIPVIGGATYTDWRLPTQKELMQLYNAGIKGLSQTSALATNYGNVSDYWFWSSSSVSYVTSNAWFVHLGYGYALDGGKTLAYRVVCVR